MNAMQAQLVRDQITAVRAECPDLDRDEAYLEAVLRIVADLLDLPYVAVVGMSEDGEPFVTDAALAGDVLAEVARLEAEAADAAAALIARL